MIDFLDIKLPKFIAINAISTPIFNTKIICAQSGKETRYSMRDVPLFKYRILYSRVTYEQFEEFNKFFSMCRGRQYTFKMKDFSDHSISDQILLSGPSEKKILDIYKYYESHGSFYKRRIHKIIPHSEIIKINDNIINQNINYSNGTINLDRSLDENEILKISLEYEIIARFDVDSFNYTYQSDGTIAVENLDIIEVIL